MNDISQMPAISDQCGSFSVYHPSSNKSYSFSVRICGCIRVRVKLDASSFLYSRPIAHLPCPAKATLAVRCCPVYFELRTKKGDGKDTQLFYWLLLIHIFHLFSKHFYPSYKRIANSLSLPPSLLSRWQCPAPAQHVWLALQTGVCCGLRGFHLPLWHSADPTFRLRLQHPLPHTQRPHLVHTHSSDVLYCSVFDELEVEDALDLGSDDPIPQSQTALKNIWPRISVWG